MLSYTLDTSGYTIWKLIIYKSGVATHSFFGLLNGVHNVRLVWKHSVQCTEEGAPQKMRHQILQVLIRMLPGINQDETPWYRLLQFSPCLLG